MIITCETPIPRAGISRMGEIGPRYAWPAHSSAELAEFAAEAARVNEKFESGESHDLYIKRSGIHQRRMVYGIAIILLGLAFRDNGLPFRNRP